MVKIKEVRWPQKKRKARIDYANNKIGFVLHKRLPQEKKDKLFRSLTINQKVNQRLAKKYFQFKHVIKKRKDFRRRYRLFEIRLGLRLPPQPKIKAKKSFSITKFKHLVQGPEFTSKMIRFLLIYPFSATTIAKVFEIQLKPYNFIIKNYKKLLYFLNFVKIVAKKNYADICLRKTKLKEISKLVRKILIKNILNDKKKSNIGQEKYMKLYGVFYKMLPMKKSKRYVKIKSKITKLILKQIKKNEFKEILSASKENRSLTRLLVLLDSLKKIKDIGKKTKIKNVQKTLNYNENKNNLDFFYKKHIEEMEEYCFK